MNKKEVPIYKTFIFWLIITIGLCIILSFIITNFTMLHITKKQFLNIGNWIEVIVGSLSAITTAELGYVAIWQNKKLNQINEDMASRQKIEYNMAHQSIIEFQPQYSFEIYNTHENYFNKISNIDINGIYVFDTDEKYYINCNEKLLINSFDFLFKCTGEKLKNIACENFYICKDFKNNNDYKYLYHKYNVYKKNKNKVNFTYEPINNTYHLSIHILDKEKKFMNASDRKLLTFNIELILESIFGVKTKYTLGLNLENIYIMDLNSPIQENIVKYVSDEIIYLG